MHQPHAAKLSHPDTQAAEGKRARTGSSPKHSEADEAAQAAKKSANLREVISARHLYCPGRLLHIQRRPGHRSATQAATHSGSALQPEAANAQAHSAQHQADGQCNAAGQCPAEASAGVSEASAVQLVQAMGTAAQVEQFVLVDGDPEARFEFIAVRSTWIQDHYLSSITQALEAVVEGSAETGS
jgi:hypothetical protein